MWKEVILLFFIVCLLSALLIGCDGAGLTPTFPEEQEEESVVGTIMAPEGSKSRELSDWLPLPGATVTLTDSVDQTHTVITDENGNYSFFQIAAGSNYIITATGEVKGNAIVLKDIVPQLEVGEKYNAGIADAESTALALLVEDILDKDIEPDLDTIQQSVNYNTLVDEVLSALEQNNNIMTEPEIKNSIYNSLDELIEPWDGWFCGVKWLIESYEKEPVDPGPNYYSNSINNVWLDDKDKLHLKIIKRNGKWYCTGIETQYQGWGYGKYAFDIETVMMKKEDESGKISYINDLDENAVVGLYTYDNNTTHKSHNELDIEFAKWGNPDSNIGNFVVWYDTTQSGNKRNYHTFPIDVGGNYTYGFEWTANNIIFYSSGMTSCPLYPESFQYKEGDKIVGTSGEGYGYIPIPNKEKVLMNIWLNGGKDPADNNIKEIEVVINNFQFEEDNSTYDLRDIGPAGGYIFYDKGSYSNGWRYLEAAPASTEWTGKQWGSYGTWIRGTETGIGTGQSNTTKIVTWLNSHSETDRATQLCNALVYGGYSDWFLPSADELDLIYNNLFLFGVGGFEGEIIALYWGSSESNEDYIPDNVIYGNAYYAWAQDFSDGDKGYDHKNNAYRVRAVRAF